MQIAYLDTHSRDRQKGEVLANGVCMLILDSKLQVNKSQQAATDEAIRATQFIRNKALRLWMDGRGISQYALQALCAQLASEHPFAARQEFHGPPGSCRSGMAVGGSLLQELPRAEARDPR